MSSHRKPPRRNRRVTPPKPKPVSHLEEFVVVVFSDRAEWCPVCQMFEPVCDDEAAKAERPPGAPGGRSGDYPSSQEQCHDCDQP